MSPVAFEVAQLFDGFPEPVLILRDREVRYRNPAAERLFQGVRDDLDKLPLACYFSEVAELLAVEGEPCEELLSLTLNSLHALDKLNALPQGQKDKVEFLCNECCYFGCRDRRACYEAVSRKNLGEGGDEHRCHAPDAAGGYRFSKAMENPGFIGVADIQQTYLPMGFENFKIEGRELGSALVLEFLLYYLTKPECQLKVREEIYLDNMLDLF